MSTKYTPEELRILNHGFHILARNLFTYGHEIGTFMAVSDKDKAILKVRDSVLEETNELIDDLADLLVRAGKQARVGSYKPEYTYWSFRTETSMLPEYLRELAEDRLKLIRLRNSLGDEGNEGLRKLFDAAIESRAKSIEAFNGVCEGVCEPQEIADADSSLEGKIKVTPGR